MRIAIVGSRDYPNLAQVREYITFLSGMEVVSGGAKGVDQEAVKEAIKCKLMYTVFPADWSKYGKRAGFLRNQQIVEYSDAVTAFWDGKSKGTKHTMDLAKVANKPVLVYYPDQPNGEWWHGLLL